MRDRHWLGLALLALGPWGAGASCRAGQVVEVVNRGGCVFNSGDTCFSTPNYPTGLYDSNEHCEVEVCSGVSYTLSGFSVEAGSDTCTHDSLSISGTGYCGFSGSPEGYSWTPFYPEPGQSNVPDVTGYLSQGDVVSFTTDHAGVHNGFRICFTVTETPTVIPTKVPTEPPTFLPTTPAPTLEQQEPTPTLEPTSGGQKSSTTSTKKPTRKPTQKPTEPSASGHDDTGAIVGGSVGGLAFIGGLVYYFKFREKTPNSGGGADEGKINLFEVEETQVGTLTF